MKLVRLFEMCLNETYSEVCMGNFSIQTILNNGDSLSWLHFNFALEYVIKKVLENQGGVN
jgi:hypothetical protein